MTFAALGAFASAQRNTSSSTYAFTTSAALNPGELAVLIIGSDNNSGSQIDQGTVDSIDHTSATWVCAGFWNENSSDGSGTAVSIWFAEIVTTVASGATLTISFNPTGTTVAAAVTGYRFSRDTTKHVVPEGASYLYASADPGAIQLTGLENREHLVVRAIAGETNVTTFTPTATFTAFGFTSSTTSGGGATANIGTRGEFKIETGTSTTSSDPTYTSAECASLLVAFAEITPGVGDSSFISSTLADTSYAGTLSAPPGNGGPRALVFGYSGSVAATVASYPGVVPAGGVSILGTADNGVVGTGAAKCTLFTAALAAGSTATNSATVSLGSNDSGVAFFASFTDVAAAPVGAFLSSTSATSTAPSLTTTIAPGNILLAALATGKQAGAATSNGFPNFNLLARKIPSATAQAGAFGVLAGKTASLSPGWASANGLGWAMAGVEIKANSASADTLFGQACL